MKKIKKYGGLIFVSIFSLLVGLGTLLTSMSNKEDIFNNDSSTISLSSFQETKEQAASARSVSDSDIENYISGKTAQGELFYPFDIIVNKVISWTEEYYYTGYSEDEQGYAYFDPDDSDYNIPNSYTFKKEIGRAHV